ncbi:LOW QUALITY PROTEIN: WD repeat-containing protein 64-like [Porphyrio hochstetteri]
MQTSVKACFGSSYHFGILFGVRLIKDSGFQIRDLLLEWKEPVKEFSVRRGINAFTYCRKAEVIVTGGHDKLLHLWHPAVNSSPTGQLSGHQHSIVEIVTTEKDQHVISLSCAKIFRVWDIQTLSLLQVFDSQGSPGEMEPPAMVFDNSHSTLITGSSVADIYPLTQIRQDARLVPRAHEKSINVLVHNRALHQILTLCSESILMVWDLETGYQTYQIEDARGLNTEVVCAAIEINGVYLATGACDGTVKIWAFESGQEVKALPLAQHRKDECRLLKIVYLKATESQHALVLEQSGKMKISQGNSAQTYLYVTWVLPEAVSFPRRNPVVSLSLKPDTSQTNRLFPDIHLLSDTSSLRNNAEVVCILGKERFLFLGYKYKSATSSGNKTQPIGQTLYKRLHSQGYSKCRQPGLGSSSPWSQCHVIPCSKHFLFQITKAMVARSYQKQIANSIFKSVSDLQ